MAQSEEINITPGMQRYIDKNNKYLADRDRYIREEIKHWKFDTIAVHGLYTMQDAIEDYQGAIIEPIFMCSLQAYRDSDEMAAALAYLIPTWCYSRIANPSTYYYEWTLALLGRLRLRRRGRLLLHLVRHGGHYDGRAAVFGPSGVEQVGASQFRRHGAMLRRHVPAVQRPADGGTRHRMPLGARRNQSRRMGVEDRPPHAISIRRVAQQSRPWIFRHSSGGRLGAQPQRAVDLRHHDRHARLVAPICHGADIVVQSVTKTLSTSGFGVCGAVIARKNLTSNIDNDAMKADFASYVKYLPNRDYGPNLHPMQAVMALNDMRTLRSKVDLMSRSAMRVAQFLQQHPAIESVQYLGLPNHPLHKLASRYMWLVDAEHDELYEKPVNRYGHLLSFCVRGGAEAARKMFDKLQRIWRATDLGRIKSVATIPAISTHLQQGEKGRQLAHIPPNLVRLCVGGEHPDDVIADLERALK